MDKFWLIRLKEKLFSVDISQPMMRFFGIIMAVNYPLYWVAWNPTLSYQGAELDIAMRLMATILCLGLVFSKFFFRPETKVLSVYWLGTVIYCLPFFFSFMTLVNHASAVWLMNLISAIFFVFLLFDAGVALAVLISGSAFAYLIYSLLYPPFVVELGQITLFDFFMTLLAAVVIGSLFSYKKGIVVHEKLMSLRSLAATVAHEMRTPLAVINLEAGWLRSKLQQPELTKEDINAVNDCANRLMATTNNALVVIDMLLANLKVTPPGEGSLLSIQTVLRQSIETYPLSVQESDKINIADFSDFEFYGDPDLIRHVFYNLIKNALYFIKAVRKGEIYVWVTKTKKYNVIHFKDTAKGVPSEELPYLFNRFYSKRKYGTGLGLAFCRCVMLDLGGKITCKSVMNEYTEFMLYFPIVKS